MKNNHKKRIIFTRSSLPLILKAFGKEANEAGIIVDSQTKEPIHTPEGDEITKDSFGGITKGSVIFLKKDLLTAIKLAEGEY
jgi:hypothetical protein